MFSPPGVTRHPEGLQFLLLPEGPPVSTRCLIGSYRHLQAPYLYLPSLALRAGHCSVPGVHCSLHVVPAPACVSYFTFKYPSHFCSAPWTYLCYFTLAISLSGLCFLCYINHHHSAVPAFVTTPVPFLFWSLGFVCFPAPLHPSFH